MATENTQTGFGQVSRVRNVVFEKLTLGASLFGILALAVLLIYVSMDAFDLTNASPGWLATYFLTLVVPFLGFCLYSADDQEILRRSVTALLGGLIAMPVAFFLIETLLRPIPALTWQLGYLFVVVVPVTGYLIYAGSREPLGQVGFGLLGRLVGGAAVGTAVHLLFFGFDERLWLLAYTFGLFPAALVYAYGTQSDGSRIGSVALPIGVVGTVVAVVVRDILAVYPTTALIYLWTLSVPVAVVTGVMVTTRGGSRIESIGAGAVVLLAAVGGFGAGFIGGPPALLVLIGTVTAGTTLPFLYTTYETRTGIAGLSLPVLLLAGTLMGATLVGVFGLQGPNPWLDLQFVTEAPSSTAAEAGLFPAIVGSVIIISMVAALSFVLGVGTAVFLEEYTSESGLIGSFTRIIQINIANLAAVPSVVYGLLGLGLFANLLGLGFGTAVTASLTLSLLILPITIVSAQEAIRSVPEDLRHGSDAMGATRWQTTKNVVLPQALPGILTGTILALGRAIGETAPLIMIGAATTVFSAPTSIWSKFTAMPLQVFAWSDFAQAEFRYGVVAAGVVTLLIVLIGMNAFAIILRNRTERGV